MSMKDHMYGSERVMLVDDEPDIVHVEAKILERLGYKVTAHTNSMQALEEFSSRPDDFDLLITDMTMPVMQGDALCEKINQIRSDIPILVCTGFSQSMTREKASSIGIKGFILKPVVLKEFSAKIREVLTY